MSDDEDFLARMVAGEDQAIAAVEAMAKRLGAYRVALIFQGFQPDEIFQLVADYHLTLLELSTRGDDGE